MNGYQLRQRRARGNPGHRATTSWRAAVIRRLDQDLSDEEKTDERPDREAASHPPSGARMCGSSLPRLKKEFFF